MRRSALVVMVAAALLVPASAAAASDDPALDRCYPIPADGCIEVDEPDLAPDTADVPALTDLPAPEPPLDRPGDGGDGTELSGDPELDGTGDLVVEWTSEEDVPSFLARTGGPFGAALVLAAGAFVAGGALLGVTRRSRRPQRR